MRVKPGLTDIIAATELMCRGIGGLRRIDTGQTIIHIREITIPTKELIHHKAVPLQNFIRQILTRIISIDLETEEIPCTQILITISAILIIACMEIKISLLRCYFLKTRLD